MAMNSCICIYARPLRKTKPYPNHLDIEVVVGFCGLLDRKVQIRHKTPLVFLEPRAPFLSPNPDERCRILSAIIAEIETPFPLQHLYWKYGKLPQETDRSHSIDELIAGTLADVSHYIALNKDYTTMEILLLKHEKVEKTSPHPYLLTESLVDWVMENPGIEYGAEPEHLETILELREQWNEYCGVRSARIEEEERECSICIRGLEKGKYEIRMPCTHVFHGFCILKWLANSPTCPICRFRLFTREERQCLSI